LLILIEIPQMILYWAPPPQRMVDVVGKTTARTEQVRAATHGFCKTPISLSLKIVELALARIVALR
jgi:hypothetical protein